MKICSVTSLKESIFEKIDEESLYKLSEIYPSLCLDTEKEYFKRLFSDTANIIDFLLSKKIYKSQLITNGLKSLKMHIPWSIGVIYDYRYGDIKSVEIRLGDGFGKYFYKNQPLIFNWLYSDKHKLMLKEITHNSVDLGVDVIDFLLFNESLDVEIAIIKQEQSFSHAYGYPLTEVEIYILFPVKISNGEKFIQLKELKCDIIKSYRVHIRKSELVKKYLRVLSY
jgi:hypothetical protein